MVVFTLGSKKEPVVCDRRVWVLMGCSLMELMKCRPGKVREHGSDSPITLYRDTCLKIRPSTR